jgi:hypothetical protein
MKEKSLIGMLLFLFTFSFVSCSNDDDGKEKQVNLTPRIKFIQDGKELTYPTKVHIFKGSEEYLKEYNYNTTYHYFERKKDNALFAPSYTFAVYPPGVIVEDKQETIPIDDNTVYTISYKMIKEKTNFYFVEYDLEVNGKDIVLERTFTIDSNGNVTKE